MSQGHRTARKRRSPLSLEGVRTESVAFPRKLFHPVTRVPCPFLLLPSPSPSVPFFRLNSNLRLLPLSLSLSRFLTKLEGNRILRLISESTVYGLNDGQSLGREWRKVGRFGRKRKRDKTTDSARLDSTRSGIEIRSETRRWPRCRLGTNIRNGRREGGERRYQLLAELVNEHSHDILISLTATFAKHRGLKNLKTFFLTDYDDDDDGDGFFLARYERNKRNTGKRILGRGYIWLWPEFSRVNLTRPVSLVSSSPRNRINRDPLRTVFSLSLPSFLSFFHAVR